MPSRRSYRARPNACSSSSSSNCCNSRWIPCRANASSVSHTGLDSALPLVLFSFIGGVSFPGVPAPVVRWLRTEGYTAFSPFTHPVTLPRNESDRSAVLHDQVTAAPRAQQVFVHERLQIRAAIDLGAIARHQVGDPHSA